MFEGNLTTPDVATTTTATNGNKVFEREISDVSVIGRNIVATSNDITTITISSSDDDGDCSIISIIDDDANDNDYLVTDGDAILPHTTNAHRISAVDGTTNIAASSDDSTNTTATTTTITLLEYLKRNMQTVVHEPAMYAEKTDQKQTTSENIDQESVIFGSTPPTGAFQLTNLTEEFTTDEVNPSSIAPNSTTDKTTANVNNLGAASVIQTGGAFYISQDNNEMHDNKENVENNENEENEVINYRNVYNENPTAKKVYDRNLDIDDVCVNMDDVCVNMDDVCVNMDDVCVNMGDVCTNIDDVCVNVEDVCVNVDDVRVNVDDVHLNMDDVCPNMDDICVKMDDVCPNMDDICVNMDDVCPNINEVCANADYTTDKTGFQIFDVASNTYTATGKSLNSAFTPTRLRAPIYNISQQSLANGVTIFNGAVEEEQAVKINIVHSLPVSQNTPFYIENSSKSETSTPQRKISTSSTSNTAANATNSMVSTLSQPPTKESMEKPKDPINAANCSDTITLTAVSVGATQMDFNKNFENRFCVNTNNSVPFGSNDYESTDATNAVDTINNPNSSITVTKTNIDKNNHLVALKSNEPVESEWRETNYMHRSNAAAGTNTSTAISKSYKKSSTAKNFTPFILANKLRTAAYENAYDDDAEVNKVFVHEVPSFQSKELMYETIPIMICDIKRLDHELASDKSAILKFLNVVTFRRCVLHARVVGRLTANRSFYRYIIDDGTGNIVLSINKQQKVTEDLKHMQNELNAKEAVAAQSEDQNTLELCACMKRLMALTFRNLDLGNLDIGTKLFIWGRPSSFRNEMQLEGHHVTPDVGLNRDIEIALKEHIIEWYDRKYPSLGVKFGETLWD